MFERLQAVEDRYEELNELLSDPNVVNDPEKLRKYSKEQADIEETVEVFREYKSVMKQYDDAQAMLEEKLDDEMYELVKEEIEELSKRRKELEDRLKVLLLPKDPNDDKNVILEIRGAAGGDEAQLFAGICSECIAVMRNRKAGESK